MTESPTIDKLLPCPFCGGDPRLVGLGEAPECFVFCSHCDQTANTEAVAIKRWNTRTPQEPLFSQRVAIPKLEDRIKKLEQACLDAYTYLSNKVVVDDKDYGIVFNLASVIDFSDLETSEDK